MAFLLVAADEVIAILFDHPVQLGNLVGRVLQVGIHGNDDIALCLFEATIEGRALAVVAAELNALDVLGLLSQLIDDFP